MAIVLALMLLRSGLSRAGTRERRGFATGRGRGTAPERNPFLTPTRPAGGKESYEGLTEVLNIIRIV